MTERDQSTLSEELQKLLSALYTPEEIEVWLDRPQSVFGDVTPRKMIATGRETEMIETLMGILDGAYL